MDICSTVLKPLYYMNTIVGYTHIHKDRESETQNVCSVLPFTGTDDEKSVLVQGILGLNKEILELFFENKKKCDGGDIESIEISEEDDEAIIVYCDPGGKLY